MNHQVVAFVVLRATVLKSHSPKPDSFGQGVGGFDINECNVSF